MHTPSSTPSSAKETIEHPLLRLMEKVGVQRKAITLTLLLSLGAMGAAQQCNCSQEVHFVIDSKTAVA